MRTGYEYKDKTIEYNGKITTCKKKKAIYH